MIVREVGFNELLSEYIKYRLGEPNTTLASTFLYNHLPIKKNELFKILSSNKKIESNTYYPGINLGTVELAIALRRHIRAFVRNNINKIKIDAGYIEENVCSSDKLHTFEILLAANTIKPLFNRGLSGNDYYRIYTRAGRELFSLPVTRKDNFFNLIKFKESGKHTFTYAIISERFYKDGILETPVTSLSTVLKCQSYPLPGYSIRNIVSMGTTIFITDSIFSYELCMFNMEDYNNAKPDDNLRFDYLVYGGKIEGIKISFE